MNKKISLQRRYLFFVKYFNAGVIQNSKCKQKLIWCFSDRFPFIFSVSFSLFLIIAVVVGHSRVWIASYVDQVRIWSKAASYFGFPSFNQRFSFQSNEIKVWWKRQQIWRWVSYHSSKIYSLRAPLLLERNEIRYPAKGPNVTKKATLRFCIVFVKTYSIQRYCMSLKPYIRYIDCPAD